MIISGCLGMPDRRKAVLLVSSSLGKAFDRVRRQRWELDMGRH